ncbi:MAG TPA: hypothetical protein VJ673_21330 [Aromatoleum sp.]|uniref:hypothetical protein n=1 Tax=Aromatoleum sp. TaxID=2307007 RepID=UPI002B474E39|nr:hypothetical protein [Aromatoleum sp.]HJV28233.1 hypothetical protein [Aromatoleum sp.]
MKKVLLLLVLLAGLVFLIKTGHDYTPANRLIASVKVWNEMRIEFDQVPGNLTELGLQAKYGDIRWNCGSESSRLGDRSCYADMRTVNGADAWFVVFFFQNGHLAQIKIDTTRKGYAELLAFAKEKYGSPRPIERDGSDAPQLIGWTLANGVLTTTELADGEGTSQFLWISKNRLMNSTSQRQRAVGSAMLRVSAAR